MDLSETSRLQWIIILEKISAAEEIKYILEICHMIRFFDLRSWSFLKFGSMVLYKVYKTERKVRVTCSWSEYKRKEDNMEGESKLDQCQVGPSK